MEPEDVDADPMSRNNDLANVLSLIGSYYSMSGPEDRYRARTYLNAATRISEYPYEISSGRQAQAAISGIGKSTAETIDDYLNGKPIQRLQELETIFLDRKRIIDEFMSFHGIGPVSATKFYNQGFRTLSDLWTMANLTDAQRIGILWRDHISHRISHEEMNMINDQFGLILNPYNIKWTISGSYRREEESSGDIDLLVESRPDLNMDGLIYMLKDLLPATLAQGPTKFMGIFRLSDATFGHRIDIRLVDPTAYPFALLYFTGSQRFNILMRQRALELNMTLNEYGLFNSNGTQIHGLTTEQDIFAKLNIPYTAPNLRSKTIASLPNFSV